LPGARHAFHFLGALSNDHGWCLRLGILPVPPDPLHWSASRTGDYVASRRRHLLQCALDLGEHFVLAAVVMYRDEISLRAVVFEQRLRLAVVVVEPPLNRLVGVVRTGPAAQAVECDLVGNLER